MIEDIIGRCAPVLGIDPADLRRRNFYAPGQATPYGQPVRHPERMVSAWDQVIAGSELVRRRAEVAAYNDSHPHTKRGLAITPVKFGISFNFTTFNQAGALVHVYKDGSVLINHGGTEMGQGLHTKMLQVAATALGCRWRGSGWRRPAPTRCPTPRRQQPVPARTSTAARSRTRASRSWPAWRRCVPSTRTSRGPSWLIGLPPADPAVGGRLLQDRGAQLGPHHDDRLAVQVLRLRRRRRRGRGRRLHRRLPRPGGSTSSTTSATASRRWSTSGRSRAGSSRAPAG